MSKPEFNNLIDNEVKRVQIQNHANFENWFASLTMPAQQMIDTILEKDLTEEDIHIAQNSRDEDWDAYQFLRMIGGGNRDPKIAPSLTNVVLGDILYDLDEYGNEDP